MKPGRNDPCPCGSGRKYKKCCYYKDQNKIANNRIKSLEPLEQGLAEPYTQDNDADYANQELMINVINNMRRLFLDKKPHIKEYYKIRDMHSEVVNAMIQYHEDGKFERIIDKSSILKSRSEVTVHSLESDFDLSTQVGIQGFYDMMIYKPASNISCITEDFIKDHRYKKPEKTEFLQSMLDSKLGLFEITGTDMKEGYAYIKDVFTDVEYTIIDIGLSGQSNYDDIYFYTRIISYNGINFGTGLNLIFAKTDNFIKRHIEEHKKDFNPNGEFERFIQLYNRYSKYPDKIRIVTHNPTNARARK